jgi:outer membrane protein OmpA-like peptidoglycan-associated protein
MEISGHTDNAGKPEKNKDLSQRRAESVKRYFVEKGIAQDRLIGKGYGDEKPIADNKKKAGKKKNRRVEFKVLSQW